MEIKMNKTERILWILDYYRPGEKLTASDVKSKINKKIKEDYPDDYEEYEISLRTIQRDLQDLEKLYKIEKLDKKDNRETVWIRVEDFQKKKHFRENELLSFHILKAYLKNFENTVIDEGIRELFNQLEEIVPGEVFDTDSIFWDKNFGKFDYFNYDTIIRRLIKFITGKKWVKIQYYSEIKRKANEFTCLPRSFFEFKGSLYVVVYLSGENAYHIVLLIQNIEEIEELTGQELIEIRRQTNVPEFKFSEWAKGRFGVFWDEPYHVKLLIDKGTKRYFENRFWHDTQKFSNTDTGDLILEMDVPIVPDLTGWILSWGTAITVLAPQQLIEIVKAYHQAAADMYG